MQKSELIQGVAYHTRLPQRVCGYVIDTFLDEVKQTLINGEEVKLKQFGNFAINTRGKRSGLDLQSGEVVIYPARRVVKFNSCQELKDKLNEIPVKEEEEE